MSKLACFVGVHEWEIIKHGRWRDPETGDSGNYYDLRCKCCGKIKSKET